MPHDDNLVTLLYLLLSNVAFITTLICFGMYYMISQGYKSVTVRFKKDKKSKSAEKLNEERYLSRLEKNVKKKNSQRRNNAPSNS